jgi:hypothetical protein
MSKGDPKDIAMPYEIGHAPKGSRMVSQTVMPTALQALETVEALQPSDGVKITFNYQGSTPNRNALIAFAARRHHGNAGLPKYAAFSASSYWRPRMISSRVMWPATTTLPPLIQ